MNLKYLMCGAFTGVISCATMSVNGTTVTPFQGCCTFTGTQCTTNADCSTYNYETCGMCGGLNPDPVVPVEPVCEEPKVYDSSSFECVCPNVKNGVAPTCNNGHFDDNTCTCSCNAGYYQNGDACNKCPDNGTSAAGSTSITSCYVTTFTDDTGSGTYTSNCYYKE